MQSSDMERLIQVKDTLIELKEKGAIKNYILGCTFDSPIDGNEDVLVLNESDKEFKGEMIDHILDSL